MSGPEENARGGCKERARLEVVFLATAWGPKHGGINAFNMDFACALGRILENGRVACVVLDATDADVRSASAASVELLQVSPSRYHSAFEASRAFDVLTRLREAGADFAANTWWVGHDAHTGELANAMRKVSNVGKSVVFHHMSYEDYQGFMHSDAQKAQRKADLQREIFSSADRTFAVGPLLLESLKRMLEPSGKYGSARMVVPGLAQIRPCRGSLEPFRAITFGRMSRETDRIKQVRLAIASFADACSVKKNPDAVPRTLQGQPQLYVYGIDQAEESQLREYAAELADRVLAFMPLPFGDRDSIFAELRQADVAMMLSWHEGFGLVGWEAISAEVPLIVTRNSGLYKLVDAELGDGGTALLLTVDIEAREDPSGLQNFSPGDLEKTRKAIWKCAGDRERAKQNARTLLQMLRQKHYTWESAGRKFAEELGLGVSLSPASVGEFASPAGVVARRGLPRMRHGSTEGGVTSVQPTSRAEDALDPIGFRPAGDSSRAFTHTPIRKLPKKFLVAFSFAGEQRELVRAIAEAVQKRLGPRTVFFDEWFEHFIAGHDADLRLQEIYGEQSELVIVCVSERYGGKPWTLAEHEAIRARFMRIRTSQKERDKLRILPIRVGEGEVKGILIDTTIVPDVRERSAAQSAELIVSRLGLIRKTRAGKKVSAPVYSSWPKEPTQFKHGLGDRTDLEWPAVLWLLTSDSRKRLLMFKGPSAYGKSALLGAATKYAKLLRVPTVYVDFKDPTLLSVANVLRELQVGLARVLPEFAAQKNPDRWTLRQALQALREPALILLDAYEVASETKELSEWIEAQLLTEAEEYEHLRFIIGGQKVPDSTGARWRDRAEMIELQLIPDHHIWKVWVDEINPQVDEKHVEGIVLGLKGLPGPISTALETCAKVLLLKTDAKNLSRSN
jgi:glycosyltransferase involved in cell wall biosynthesis